MFKTILAALLMLLPAFASGSEPFTIISGSGERSPKQPQACVDRMGIAHVAFGVGADVYYCRAGVDEKPSPLVAFQVPNMSLGMRRGPRIAHTGDAIVITAIGGPQGKGADGDVLAYRSIDGGKSWLGPVKVNDIEASAREGLHAMTASEDGTLWCVWLDLRAKRTQLFASKSIDHGANWSKNQLVYQSPDGSICECCHPSVVADQNSVHVLFRNSLKGKRDMYLASSEDRGDTFDSVVRLGESSWQLNACPMDGGMLAMDKRNKITTVWRRDRTLLLASPRSGLETTLGTGEQPWVASDGDSLFEVWTSKRDGDLLMRRTGSTRSEQMATNASFPVVVASNASEAVYVLWEQRSGDTTTLLGRKIQ